MSEANRSDTTKKAHWDHVYQNKASDKVSWFQPKPSLSLAFIDEVGLGKDASIIDVGGGASTLVDDLLDRGYTNLTVLDLSAEALRVSRERLGARAAHVKWIEADVTSVQISKESVDFWHDRAVFHFLTDEQLQQRYISIAARSLKPDAHIVVATFAPNGPEQCSGLPVTRYDADALHRTFGYRFAPVQHTEEMHQTPWGTIQSFTYCYCRLRAR